jgi:hypothetical protein
MKLPVLICCFNRPETTAKVIEAVGVYRPDRLYISCDGSRNNRDDQAKIKAIQELVDKINWPCKVLKNYAENNLGCARAVEMALKWFFSHESKGIVLEDDTVPSDHFFEFCEYGLDRFQANPNVQGISGNFLLPAGLERFYPEPMSLSRYFFCWGWASWADRIENFSLAASHWSEADFLNASETKKIGAFEKDFWKTRFQLSYQDRYPGWATKLLHQAWVANRKWIVPNRDLVVNIGFGEDSTNTKGSALSFFLEKENLFKQKTEQELFPVQDEVQELLRFQYIFNKDWSGLGNTIAETEFYKRMISYKKQVYELEALVNSPLKWIKYQLYRLKFK